MEHCCSAVSDKPRPRGSGHRRPSSSSTAYNNSQRVRLVLTSLLLVPLARRASGFSSSMYAVSLEFRGGYRTHPCTRSRGSQSSESCGRVARLHRRCMVADGSSSKFTLPRLTMTIAPPEASSIAKESSGGVSSPPAEAGSMPSSTAKVPRSQRLRVAMFFFFWYTFNVGYNLYTKFTLNVLPLPFTLAAVQLLAGVPYVWLLWMVGLRKRPKLTLSQFRQTLPVTAAHTMAHLGAVVSIGAGAVGFVQIVKAAEPLFTATLSFLTGSAMPWPVYLTLLPVIGGVAMASFGEISFSLLAFAAAMTSNASAASRSVLGKKFMARKDKGDNMDAGNLYALMTMVGSVVLIPLAVALEGPRVAGVWSSALSAGQTTPSLVKNCLLGGLFFYLYNEVSFYALNVIHPVTHALGNTLKRVVMITVSVIVLKHRFTPLGLLGCSTALGGVLAYSVSKAKLQNRGKPLEPSSSDVDALVTPSMDAELSGKEEGEVCAAGS